MAVLGFMFWLTFCTCFVVVCVASPTRRQFVPETTSSEPAVVVTNEGEVWDDTDDFDLDGDEDWLGESAASPSSIPRSPEYEDYDDDDDTDDFAAKRPGFGNIAVDDDDDVEHQDAEEEDQDSAHMHNNAEFLFLPSTDTRLMLQDDDGDQSGLIKVRHTGKNSYSEVGANSLEEENQDEDDGQFEFTIGDDEKENDLDKDDFVLEDPQEKDSDNSVEELPRRDARDDDDDNDDEDDGDDDDIEDDPVFQSPEEDSQVIYGDHVFLY